MLTSNKPVVRAAERPVVTVPAAEWRKLNDELDLLRGFASEVKAATGADYRLTLRLGLTRRQSDLLGLLMSRPVVSLHTLRLVLFDGGQSDPVTGIHVLVSKLRRKLARVGVPIEAIYGTGYKLARADIERLTEIAAEVAR